MKNRIEKINDDFILTLIDGRTFELRLWTERKKRPDGSIKEMVHLIIPKEAQEICGRTYVRLSYFDNSDIYEFENKEEHREGLGNGGWKSRLTDEERTEYESCEKRMEELKKIALSRPVRELTEEEKVEKELMKVLKKKSELLGIPVETLISQFKLN